MGSKVALRSLVALIACASLVGCGDSSGTSSAADAQTSDATASADAALDAAPDTADVPPSDGAPADAVAADTAPAPDAVVVKSACDVLLPCALQCAPGAGFSACVTDCGKSGSDAAQTQLQAVATCVTDLCADATSTAANIGCAANKCLSQLGKCGGWAGKQSCEDVFGCAARCTLNDDLCRITCLAAANATAGSDYGSVAACAGKNCATAANPAAYAACVAGQCGAAVTTCKGAGLDCTGLVACKAKCPESVSNKPNACKELCDLLGTEVGLAADATYTACKDACKGARGGGPACIAKSCTEQRLACFPDTGTDTCAKIYKNVVDLCEGIGGEPACIAGQVAKGASLAKEAFLNYEGCILDYLTTDIAEQSGCSFPYDQKTCIDVLTGYCGSFGQTCFKQN